MRRIINFSRDYATKRLCFGQNLTNHPLHMYTLSNLEVECRGSFLFLMYIASLLGKIECNIQTEEDIHLLRLLTPLLKLYSGKQVTAVCSEALESFGGQG
jgi:alkylation response protein AidB-like acyl-CoA dehydrogenase